MRPPVREAAPSPYPIRTNVFEPETNESLIREVIQHEAGRAAPGSNPAAVTPRSAPPIRMTVLEPASVEAPVREIITPEAQGLSQSAEQGAAQTPAPHAIQQNVFERDPDEAPVREVIRLSPMRAAPRPAGRSAVPEYQSPGIQIHESIRPSSIPSPAAPAASAAPFGPAAVPSVRESIPQTALEDIQSTPLIPAEQQMTAPASGGSSAAASSEPASQNATDSYATDSEFLAARSAFQKKNAKQLEHYAARLRNHPLGAYAEYWNLLLALRAQPDDPERQKAMERFISRHHGEYIAERAKTDWARLSAVEGDARRFAQLYRKLDWNQDEADLVCWRMFYELEAGSKTALRQAKEYLRNAPAGKDACAKLGLAAIAADSSWGWNYVLLLTQKRFFTQARKTIEILPPESLPASKSALNSIIGNPSAWHKKNQDKLSAFSGKALALAAIRLAQVDLDKAAEVAQSADPRLDAATRALMWARLGQDAAMKQNLDAADYYRRAGVLAKAAPLAANYTAIAVWRARNAVLSGNPAEIERAIETLPHEEKAKPAWVYWKGRALLARGQKARAERLLAPLCTGHEFYNLLACDALGHAYAQMPRHLTPSITKAQIAAFDQNPSLKRALRFYENNLIYEGNREWNWAYRGMKITDMPHLSEYARLLGITHRQINTAQRGQRAVLEQLYPRAYEKAIQNAAASAELPEYWVFGLIRQESRFVPHANSSVGAKGLMQIMPGTARWVAKHLSMKSYKRHHITNLDTNLVLGSRYLKLVLDALEGSVPLATAGYNAGPNRPQLWRSRLKRPVEGAAFAENIPFTETRGYVQNVTANAVHYSRYEGKPIRLTKLLGTVNPSENTKISLP